MSKKHHRAVLENQTREIIGRVYDFMKKEALANYAEKLTDARWRTAQAAGVSESTVTRILRKRRVEEKKKKAENNESCTPEDNRPTTEQVMVEPFVEGSEDEYSIMQTNHTVAVVIKLEDTTPRKKRKVEPDGISDSDE